MLYIKEADGVYLPAKKEDVFHEAKRLAGSLFNARITTV